MPKMAFSAAAFAVFSSPLFVLADDADAQNTQALKEIERITTTASRLAYPGGKLPVAIDSVYPNGAAQFHAGHIGDLTEQVAGVYLQKGNGQEYLPALRSPVWTGTGACSGIMTLEDGIALRGLGFCNVNELFEAGTEYASRIEVLKGPVSALYGANAVHGVINVITKDTTFDHLTLQGQAGSYGYKRVGGSAGHEFDASSGIGVSVNLTRDSGFRDDESVTQDKWALKYRTQWRDWQVDQHLAMSRLSQETAGYIVGDDAYLDSELAQTNPNPEAFRQNRVWRGYSRLTKSSDDNTLVITPYFRHQDMAFLKHFLPGKPLEENSQTGLGVHTLWQYQLTPKLQTNLGFDVEYTQGDMLQVQDTPTEGSAFLKATIPTGKHYDYSVDAYVLGQFFEARYETGDWLVQLGGRFEQVHFSYTNQMNSGRLKEDGTACGMGGCRYARPESQADDYSHFSPKFGVSYALNLNTRAYAHLAKGERTPHTAELYQLQRAQQKAELDNETAKHAEVGIKGEFAKGRYQASVYRMTKQNIIYRDKNFFNINGDGSSHHGVELSGLWLLTSDLTWHFNYAYGKHTYDSERVLQGSAIDGNAMDTAPKHLASTRFAYQLNDAWHLTLGANHVSQYFTNAENTHSYPGHTLVNFKANWQVSDKLAMSLDIRNVLDKAYASRADFTGFTGARYFPGRGREAFLSLDYTF